MITLFDYPDDTRNVIYTTNVIEPLHSVIRKAVKNRLAFPLGGLTIQAAAMLPPACS